MTGRIPRVTQPIFAGSATNNGVFGSAADGPKVLSNDLSTLMSKPAWATGWLSAVLGSSKFPALEEFQALIYITTTQIANIFQDGIPLYDAGTTYYTKCLVREPATYKIYGSKTNANLGNALSDGTNWELLIDFGSLPTTNVFTGGTTGGAANVQTLATVSPAATAFTNGQMVICTAGFTNTGSATFNAGGEGALTIKKNSGAGLVVLTGNEINAGDTLFFTKNVPGTCWVLTDQPSVSALTVVRRQVLNASGTYTPNQYMLYAEIEIQAPGGGSSGVDTTASTACPGAGGAYAKKLFTAADIGASQTYTQGAVGSAGTNAPGAGGDAGASSLGSLLVVNGGKGGPLPQSGNTISDPAVGGTVSTAGDISIPGGSAGFSMWNTGTPSLRWCGEGGDSVLGKGGKQNTTPGAAGSAGTGKGSGAGAPYGNGSAMTGVAGQAGQMIATEYCYR